MLAPGSSGVTRRTVRWRWESLLVIDESTICPKRGDIRVSDYRRNLETIAAHLQLWGVSFPVVDCRTRFGGGTVSLRILSSGLRPPRGL